MGLFNRFCYRKDAMVQRLTYRRRLSYNTSSNLRKISKTPGGRLVYLHKKKFGAIPTCPDTKKKLFGIKPARPRQLMGRSRRLKTVPVPMVDVYPVVQYVHELFGLFWSKNKRLSHESSKLTARNKLL